MNLCTDCYWTDRCDRTSIEDYIDGVTYTIGNGEEEGVTCDMYDPLPKYKVDLTDEEEYKTYLWEMQDGYMRLFDEAN